MNKFLITLLVVSGSLLVSCNPARRINMINHSNEDAHIIWTMKEDSAKTSPLFISNALELKFELKPTKPHNEANMSMGVGKWTDETIKSIVDDMESLVIVHKNDSVKLDGESAIWSYLQERRKGITKNRIDIVLK